MSSQFSYTVVNDINMKFLVVVTPPSIHQRSSGRRYESYRRHAFIVGAMIKGIIVMVLYSKAFRNCDDAEKRREEVEEHDCPKNFEGSSKIMEASASLKMVEQTD